MVLAGLLISLGIVALTWLIVTMAECGLTIGMLFALPFAPLIEKIAKKMDKRTDEEKRIDMEYTLRVGKPARTYDEIKEEAINKFFH